MLQSCWPVNWLADDHLESTTRLTPWSAKVGPQHESARLASAPDECASHCVIRVDRADGSREQSGLAKRKLLAGSISQKVQFKAASLDECIATTVWPLRPLVCCAPQQDQCACAVAPTPPPPPLTVGRTQHVLSRRETKVEPLLVLLTCERGKVAESRRAAHFARVVCSFRAGKYSEQITHINGKHSLSLTGVKVK